MESVAVPAPRNELTPREEWALRTKPKLIRVAVLVGVFTLIVAGYAETIVNVWPWHPWREHQWILCGTGYGKTQFALYTQHPRLCGHAPFAPLDCAKSCEAPQGATDWQVCEATCPEERLSRVHPWGRERW